MNPDEFEQQLRSLPLRSPPASWRVEILTVARALKRPPASAPIEGSMPWWREWLWPCPQAWAGLAAVWLLLLGLRVLPPATSTSTLAGRPMHGPEARVTLAAQRRELMRLLEGPMETAPSAKSPTPGPRSDLLSPSKA